MCTPRELEAATFGTVSVVMIARENESPPAALIVFTRTGMAAVTLSVGNGRPMTPVDEMKISVDLHSRLFASDAAHCRAAFIPASPVTAFALPAFTSTARTELPEARR